MFGTKAQAQNENSPKCAWISGCITSRCEYTEGNAYRSDDFFTRGQDWGFPPLHPERTREEDHAYFWACLAHLSVGPAETVIVGREDLWLESDPHIPGPSGGDPGCDAT